MSWLPCCPLISTGKVAHVSLAQGGSLDQGKDGVNVFVYRLCPQKLSLGFANSEVIEELACKPDGAVALWLLIDDERCRLRPGTPTASTTEILEPFISLGRTTGSPVRQLLTCRAGVFGKATLVVPDAREVILATRTGDTAYEVLSRRFANTCRKSGPG